MSRGQKKTGLPKAVSAYMAKIGAEGGKKGGTAKGKRKARDPEHYRKMVEARKAKRKTTV